MLEFCAILPGFSLPLVMQAAPPAAPTYQELMDPALFPDPQRGMRVESARRDGDVIRIRTTGATILIHLGRGEVTFRQRLGHERDLAVLRTGSPWRGAELTHADAGLARVIVENPRLTVRVNGDSLFMLHAHKPLSVTIEWRIEVAWSASHAVHHLIADEWGGFGLYCSEPDLADRFDPYAESVAAYSLPEDAVLWVGVCPPKPYDWERSFEDNVIWHWSNQLGYPPDDVLEDWQPHGNIVLLQSEVMLWKDWNLDFVPRLGVEEFARVRRKIHDLGMRFIVYTSPYAFLKGTDLEPRAINSFENFTGWPPGRGTGENMELFMAAITRVMNEYKPDGLYFDGQYMQNPAALYALARRTRALLGEDGILEWHSTSALGSKDCYLPQADAYVDLILRGEGRTARYADLDYLRFFVSGYNINNSIGVLCNNDPAGYPTAELTERLLSVNGRYHTIAGWTQTPDIMSVLAERYRPRLTPALRSEVGRGVDARQAKVAAKAASIRSEREALASPPDWGAPIVAVEFDELPGTRAEAVCSAENADAFAVVDGSLRVRGKAHTFAYWRVPVSGTPTGFLVRLRLGSDGGMSWGPAALLKWEDGSMVRLGVRSDGKLQSDILGEQTVGGSHETDKPGAWVWLRARWLGRMGVIERSTNGREFERLWSFEHAGLLNSQAAELLVGKVPFNGEPSDFEVLGDVGESHIDFVRIYGH